MGGTNENSQTVQTPGGDHKAYAVRQGALACRQFRSVRMTVEDGKCADDDCGQRKVKFGF